MGLRRRRRSIAIAQQHLHTRMAAGLAPDSGVSRNGPGRLVCPRRRETKNQSCADSVAGRVGTKVIRQDMNQTFDAIILGLGGMGSAAACHLAARGKRVLGLDQYAPPHDKGSSHGQSRVIRQAYYEDPTYVPLLLRAYELWRRLEQDSRKDLLTITGGLMLGVPDSGVVAGSLRSAREHGLPHELLDATEIRKRFPPFTPEKDTVALFERNAGALRPEESVRAHLELAARNGAMLRFNEEVTAWNISGGSVHVTTTKGNYEA